MCQGIHVPNVVSNRTFILLYSWNIIPECLKYVINLLFDSNKFFINHCLSKSISKSKDTKVKSKICKILCLCINFKIQKRLQFWEFHFLLHYLEFFAHAKVIIWKYQVLLPLNWITALDAHTRMKANYEKWKWIFLCIVLLRKKLKFKQKMLEDVEDDG